MWTTVLVIMLYNSVWCIHRHIQWFMQHNFIFPKVASPSQCASLWQDVWHAHVRWFVDNIFGHSTQYGTLRCGSRDLNELLLIYSSSIWQKAFDWTGRVPAIVRRNPQQQKHSPACCNNSGPHLRHSSPNCGWRHEDHFIVVENVH